MATNEDDPFPVRCTDCGAAIMEDGKADHSAMCYTVLMPEMKAQESALRARVAELEAEKNATASIYIQALEGMFEAHKTYSDEFNVSGKIRAVCDWGLFNEKLTAARKAINDAPASAKALAEVVEELRNIAAANRKDWDCSMDEFIDQFQPWAQSRAAHALAKLDAAKGGK